MKKLLKIFFILLLFYYIYYIIRYNFIWKDTFINTLELWLYKVVVGIIPMYVLSSLLLSINFINDFLFNLFNKFKLFENSKALFLFLISFLCGTPTTSLIVSKAYVNQEISFRQARNIICSCSFISFLFLAIMLNNKLFFIISLSQIISSLIIYFKLSYKIELYNNNNTKHISMFDTINSIIEDVPIILLKILVSMILVSIIIIPFKEFEYLFYYFEVTFGLNNFLNINCNEYITIILISSLLSFNGVAIILQVYNILKKTRLIFKHYIISRIIHTIISVLISLVLLFIVNFFF